MKVLMVTNMYPNSKDPSAGVFVRSQIESLKREGVHVDLLFVNGTTSRLNYAKGIWQLTIKTLRYKYDLIHAYYGLTGLVARCQWRFPVIVTFCGSDVYRRFEGMLSRQLCRCIDKSIVQSEHQRRILKSHNAVVIPHGIDLHLFKPASKIDARRKLALSQDRKYVLFMGDPKRKVKRFDLAQESIHILNRNSDWDVELLPLFGKPQEVVPIYLNACSCLLVTSEWEGSPNSVKEAMACNLPIVSVNVGDVQEIIDSTRHCYICPRNAEEIASCLIHALEADTRTNGREHIQHLFLEHVARKIVSQYCTLLQRP